MYCYQCGVKLADTEKTCPLCQTEVPAVALENVAQRPTYPPGKMPRTRSGRKALGGAILIVYLVPLILSFFSDWQMNHRLEWFGYVAGGLMVGYVLLALPLWFKKPNPVIFVPCGFAAAALYVGYINWATEGAWYFSFALPVVGGLCLITSAVVTLVCYVKKGRLYVFGGASMLLGWLILLIEHLLWVTFAAPFIGWSIYPLIVLMTLGGLLIYLAINGDAREVVERKLFF